MHSNKASEPDATFHPSPSTFVTPGQLVSPVVLIVDDIADNRVLIHHVLRRENYTIVEAGDGEEALSMALLHTPDIILMDAMMPVMDGFEASRRIREHETIQNTPILMITALNDMDSKIRALECGVNDFIAKPFDRTEMLARIRSTISLHTKLMRKEKELKQLNQELEERVEERTRELKRQERYNRAILDSEENLVCVVSHDIITDANRAFTRFFPDISAGSSLQHLTNHFQASEKDGFLNCFEAEWYLGLFDKTNDRHKLRIEHKGKTHIFNIHATNMLYHSGVSKEEYDHDNRFIIVFSDVTEFETLKESRVRDIKLASIGKLAAGITHEINTPLAYMKGNMELMKMDVDEIGDETLKSTLLESMDTINEGISRISTIVDTVREISKKTETKREPTNIYQTLIYALRMIYNRSKQISNITLNGTLFSMDMNRDQEVYEAKVVKQRIEQVWIIILNNALDELAKSRQFDERRLDITIDETPAAIRIELKDNGGGIREDIIENIFDPFVSTKTHQGMGIGLNIAKKIIDEHRGTITAENEDDGAKFTVLLPK